MIFSSKSVSAHCSSAGNVEGCWLFHFMRVCTWAGGEMKSERTHIFSMATFRIDTCGTQVRMQCLPYPPSLFLGQE